MTAIDNLVHETSTSTGTGNFTVSAVDGRQTFNTAFGTSGTDVFYYFISHRSAGEWEVGTGSLSASTTLVRDTVLASSNADAAVNFSAGTKDVTNDIPASLVANEILTTRGDILNRGASVPERLALGTALQFLGSNGQDPVWKSPHSVGDVKTAYRQTPEAGWEAMDGSTIGSAASAASLASDSYEDLFKHLWDEDDGIDNLTVSTGKGASAQADWDDNETITLPDSRAHALGMINNSSLPAGANGSFTTRDMGDTVGAETHTMTEAQLDNHNHGISDGLDSAAGSNSRNRALTSSGDLSTTTGSNTAMNNMQPTFFINSFIYSGV